MWSEEQDNMDNRIRKAADSMPHSVNDGHWEKMEALLEEHLPEEKKKRRFFFILLLAGLLIGAGVVTVTTFSKKQTITDTNTGNQANTYTGVKQQKANTTKLTPERSISSGNTTITPGKEKQVDIPVSSEVKRKYPAGHDKSLSTTATKKQKQYIADNPIKEKKKKGSIPAPGTKEKNEETNNAAGLVSNKNITVDAEKYTDDAKDTQATIAAIELPETTLQEEEKDDSISTADSKEEKASTSKNKQPKFSILLSAGSDISGIGTKAGSPQITYGIGVAYSLSKRWTIRTGLLAAVKKYDAKPQQYHPDNYNFWIYYPRMQKIDADCFVYEIPLSAIYNFNTTKNHNWFLSTGVSSFIMKRETYDYTFKDNWGQTRYTTRTYKDEYKHWFSVLNISGGYQYRFNNKFSLLAEPYIKMPLAGVGFGHVKLNSAGILITAAIKPFSKKEK